MTNRIKVDGIGGVFFRANDPSGLANWYLKHLGIDLVPQSESGRPWHQEGGPTVFAPFPGDTDYFGADTSKLFMLNFRVSDLDGLITQLTADGVDVGPVQEMPPIGRFARLYDPEGNPVELWQPA
ncbi:MAG: VOC family protein [Pseudomonadota bacterium]